MEIYRQPPRYWLVLIGSLRTTQGCGDATAEACFATLT
jgi:hypothetical protein